MINKQTNKNTRNKIIWSLLFFVIAGATIWAVVSQSHMFSLNSFYSYIKSSFKGWLLLAVVSMLGFIFFEGEAVISICRGLGYKSKTSQGLVYSMSDIYFSAITPSATGGQPACAYFMVKDGIPVMVTTLALLCNLIMYTFAIVIIGIIVLCTNINVFLNFDYISKTLIIVGYIFQVFLIVLFLMLVFKTNLLYQICGKVLHWLCKLKLLKKEEEKTAKLRNMIEEYSGYVDIIKNKPKIMVKSFIFNMFQRLCIIAVPLFTFLATGGSMSQIMEIFAIQSYVVIGSNAIPIPGAMGASDYIMLDGFGKIMPYNNAVNFELLSRSLSFYLCIIICGISVLIIYLNSKRRKKYNDRVL